MRSQFPRPGTPVNESSVSLNDPPPTRFASWRSRAKCGCLPSATSTGELRSRARSQGGRDEFDRIWDWTPRQAVRADCSARAGFERDLRRLRRQRRQFGQQQRSGGRGRRGHDLADLPARLPRPGADLHGERDRAAVARLHPAAHLPPRRGRGGRGADPGPRRGPARDLRGRPHLHADAARRAQVLRRHPGGRLGLRAHDQARAQPRVGRLAVLPDHRGRDRVPRGRRSRGRHLRDRDRRQDRRDHDHADRGRLLVLERPRDVVRGDRPRRHAVQEPDRGPAPGRRPLHDHRVGAEPPVRDGEEPRVRGSSGSPRSRPATSTRSRPRSSRTPASRPRTCSTTSSTTCRTRRRRT